MGFPTYGRANIIIVITPHHGHPHSIVSADLTRKKIISIKISNKEEIESPKLILNDSDSRRLGESHKFGRIK